MIEELDENKLVSVTIGSRINVKYLAAITQYFHGQDIRSQGSIVRAALETFATLLIESGKVDEFTSNNGALRYINTVFPCKGTSYQKASTSLSVKNFIDKRSSDKEIILGSLSGIIPNIGGEDE